ncbi:MAG: hypothetical protein GY866_33160 [Proteobacteria bacterium]|nr:hypothetical protein [Pseudomonadota bacterium]
MGEKHVKSAIELAMEKVSKMPKLKSEEIKEHREREWVSIGEAAANKYIQGTLRTTHLATELSKYPGDNGRIVRSALLATLTRSISLEDTETNGRMFEALQAVEPREKLGRVRDGLDTLMVDYQLKKQQEYVSLVKKEKTRLQRLGISGSAVLPNLVEDEAWRQKLKEIIQRYDSKLNALKKQLPH